MPFTIKTGKDCDLTIAAKPYKDRVSSWGLTNNTDQQVYKVLDGSDPAFSASVEFELAIVFAYDGEETDSLFAALWNAAGASTPIAFVATVGGMSFTGSAIATHPPVEAKAGEVVECSVTLKVSGTPVMAATTAPAAANTTK
jgi:hypothetical protein